MVPGDGPVRGEFREATRLGLGVAPVMGQITEKVVAYRDGAVELRRPLRVPGRLPLQGVSPIRNLADVGGGHALEARCRRCASRPGTLLTDDEFVALMTAIKSRWTRATSLAMMTAVATVGSPLPSKEFRQPTVGWAGTRRRSERDDVGRSDVQTGRLTLGQLLGSHNDVVRGFLILTVSVLLVIGIVVGTDKCNP